MSERSEFCIFSKIDSILAWTRRGLIFGYFSSRKSDRLSEKFSNFDIIKEITQIKYPLINFTFKIKKIIPFIYKIVLQYEQKQYLKTIKSYSRFNFH